MIDLKKLLLRILKSIPVVEYGDATDWFVVNVGYFNACEYYKFGPIIYLMINAANNSAIAGGQNICEAVLVEQRFIPTTTTRGISYTSNNKSPIVTNLNTVGTFVIRNASTNSFNAAAYTRLMYISRIYRYADTEA